MQLNNCNLFCIFDLHNWQIDLGACSQHLLKEFRNLVMVLPTVEEIYNQAYVIANIHTPSYIQTLVNSQLWQYNALAGPKISFRFCCSGSTDSNLHA